MLKRDFTKSNKEYFKKNRNFLIIIATFLLAGILVFALCGLNGNFEIKGYNEFSISVTEKTSESFVKHQNKVGDIINSYNGDFDNMLIYGEGDNTQYVVRYLNDLNNDKILEINQKIADEIGVELSDISEHVEVGPSLRKQDILYTSAAILLLVTIATIFAYARYNAASAMAIILGSLFGTLGFISLGAILRLTIGMSYFAMLVILNAMIIYFAIDLFETMHKSNWLVSGDYAKALDVGIKSSKLRTVFISFAMLIIGLLLVIIAPITVKFVAINIMFMAVTVLGVAWYIVPFVWSALITRCRKREYKIKTNETENKTINQ